ncbi:hypothetical protein [Rhizobium phage RHph_X2_26]|nr:hypothetical protein [Rhizobium phage RHph_X2_26]
MIYIRETEHANFWAIEPQGRAAIELVRADMTLYGSRKINGVPTLVLETGRVDGFRKFCDKRGIETRMEYLR